ncbi:MAG: endonuclease/exonuclease/phosphatase family protein [Polyangiaceae bacterium]
MTLRIATLNIWNKSGPWLRRLELIRSELARSRLNVLGLQEVLRMDRGGVVTDETCQATEIGGALGYQVAYGAAADYGGGLHFGNALLSRHPIVSSRTLPLPGRESGETRSLLYALVDSPFGQLPVFVTHLNWKLHHGNYRLAQVKFIVEQIFELCPIDETKLPPVLMGDFNADPDSDEIRYLRGLATLDGSSVYFADAWSYGGDGTPGYTFDRKNAFAALAHEPPRRIDYIFSRGPDRSFRGEPLTTRLAFCDEAGGIWPSDHFGLTTELAAEPRST